MVKDGAWKSGTMGDRPCWSTCQCQQCRGKKGMKSLHEELCNLYFVAEDIHDRELMVNTSFATSAVSMIIQERSRTE